jgi:excisionase family DNA binding protein
MVQYFNLQEAAARLRVTTDQLKEMAKNGEIRAFQDRGNMRFRAQEIEELARLRGAGSDPDLPLGEAPTGGPVSDAGVFDFSLGVDDSDEVSLGQDTSGQGSAKAKGRSGSKTPGGKSPPPKAGVDSDVRLVPEGGDLDFQIDLSDPSHADASRTGSRKKDGAKAEQPDSGVRIVPLDKASDSDVKMVPDDAINPGGSERPKSTTTLT